MASSSEAKTSESNKLSSVTSREAILNNELCFSVPFDDKGEIIV